MNPLRVLTHDPPVFQSGSGPVSVLRDFAHTSHLYQPSLSLTLQRVLVVGVRSFFVLLSDACSSVWAIVVDDQQTMDLVYQNRDALRGSQVQVVLQKCMMRSNAAFFLATNIRMQGMADDDEANYVTQEGEVLPGSRFGMPAVQYSRGAASGAASGASKAPAQEAQQWRMLVCNGPRVDHYAPGGDGEAIIEHLVSFVNVCIPTLVRKERFDARLSVLRVDESQVLLTDGTTVPAECVMVATGRIPTTEGLGLEAAGIALGPRGEVPVDAYSRTAVPSIWAVGDVTDRMALTPVALREGQAFAETVFGGKPTMPDHELVATAVFTRPEIGTCGLSEETAAALGPVEIYSAAFRPMLNALSGRDEKMLMKLVVCKDTRLVLGCHVVGHAAAEMIQMAAVAMKMGATKEDFDRTVAVHPTAAEELVTMKSPVR